MNTILRLVPAIMLAATILLPASSMAHSALCSCYDNGDGNITCEGGFSDGSSAQGVRIFVRDNNDETVARGKMDEDGEFSFKKPKQGYKVIFDAGPGHQVEINGKDIIE